MDDGIETRVGYAALDVIAKEIETTIKTLTFDGRYCGSIEWINKYREIVQYLDRKDRSS